MIIDGVMVLYNPTDEVIDNVNSYLDILRTLYVFDNSTNKNSNLISLLKNNKKITYIDMEGNKGLGESLKRGLDIVKNSDATYCLTMDQDSSFNSASNKKILDYLENNVGKYAIIGLNIKNSNKKSGIKNSKTLITASNFIYLDYYRLVRGFNSDLFIDLVDFDLDEQFNAKGLKIGFIQEIKFNQTIGNPIAFKFLGKEYHAMNHEPIRYYYRYRNTKYLYKKNHLFYFWIHLKTMTTDIIKMLIFEKNRKVKFRMIKQGKKDAKNGILGHYQETL